MVGIRRLRWANSYAHVIELLLVVVAVEEEAVVSGRMSSRLAISECPKYLG